MVMLNCSSSRNSRRMWTESASLWKSTCRSSAVSLRNGSLIWRANIKPNKLATMTAPEPHNINSPRILHASSDDIPPSLNILAVMRPIIKTTASVIAAKPKTIRSFKLVLRPSAGGKSPLSVGGSALAEASNESSTRRSALATLSDAVSELMLRAIGAQFCHSASDHNFDWQLWSGLAKARDTGIGA